MIIRILGVSVVLFSALSCSKGPQMVEPSCVAAQVIYFSVNEVCETGASVLEYEFQKEVVYVFK